MADSWKTQGRPITGYLLLGPRCFEKRGVYSVETVHRDRNSSSPTSQRPQRGVGQLLFWISDQFPNLGYMF
ncbi:hypothetical protein TNCV_3123941 [Trichonephila clavipes]|nr:hypothetical protein TNCV_3123941 [Trichonephila clavipes]